MAIREGDLRRRSRAARCGAETSVLVDRMDFPATPCLRVGEKAAVNVAAMRSETVSPVPAGGTRPRRRVIRTVGRLLPALMAALAGLLLAGLIGTQALAHEGHDATAGMSAPQIEALAPMDGTAPSGDGVGPTTDAAQCDGHCCFTGACCAFATSPLSAVAAPPRAVEARSRIELDAIPPAAPDGPRRPPKREL